MVQSPSRAADWLAASQEIPPHFTEPEGSLLHSQAYATCPYPGPAQSSPQPLTTPPCKKKTLLRNIQSQHNINI